MRMVLRGSGCRKAKRTRTRAKTAPTSGPVYSGLSCFANPRSKNELAERTESHADPLHSNRNEVFFSQILDKLNKRLSNFS